MEELNKIVDELYKAGFNWEQIEEFQSKVECGESIDSAMQTVFCGLL